MKHEPIWRRYRNLIRRNDAIDAADELQFHLDMREREARSEGHSAADARQAAHRRFGDVDAISSELSKIDARRARRRERRAWWNELRQDARVALRSLRRTPVFALAAIGTIAIALAVNATVFSFVDALLFESLPYGNAEDLAVIRGGISGTVGEAVALRERSRSITDLGVYRLRSVTLNDAGDAARLDGASVTANMFDVLRVRPRLGTGFATNASDPGNEKVIILSDAVWRARFGADPSVIGRRLLVDGQSYSVVGVMPPEFRFPTARAEFWTPLQVDRGNLAGLWANGGGWFVLRLRHGTTPDAATRELRTTVAAMRRVNPLWDPGADYGKTLEVLPFRQHLVGAVRSAALLLWACAGIVLLVACVNIANLLLARATARESEMSVRAALGAERGRLVRQLLTESLVIATCGVVISLMLTTLGTRWIAATAPPDFPRLGETGMRLGVFAFSLLLTFGATLLFGLLPSMRATAPQSMQRTIRGGRTASIGVGHQSIANALVILEIAIAVTLTVAGGILTRSFLALEQLSPGFRPDHLVVAQVNPPTTASTMDPSRIGALYDGILQRVAALPGVERAAAADRLPIVSPIYGLALRIEGRFEDTHQRLPWVPHVQTVTPGYFETLEIPVAQGRSFTNGDNGQAAPVAIISQSLARQYWPGESPIGKRIGSPYPGPWISIVGVVPDVRIDSLRDTSGVALYLPFAQRLSGQFGPTSPSLSLAIRTVGDPLKVEQAIRGLVREVDPAVAVSQVRTMDGVLANSIAKPRFTAVLVGAFGIVTLLLGAVGVYGVMSYLVSQRTHEIGVRSALGASASDIATLVLRRSVVLTTLGAIAGLVGAGFITRLLPSLLFHVSPVDPLTFGFVPLLFVVVGLLAAALPARRAANCDPILALRGD